MAHKIRLKPTLQEETFLEKCCGTSRFVYNYGLSEIKNCLSNNKKAPSWMQIDKQLNSIKKQEYPWMYEVPSCIGQQALSHLGSAVSRFFKKISKFPVFKKKGQQESFTLNNRTAHIEIDTGNRLCITKDIHIKMYEKCRFAGKIMSYSLRKTANRWYVSVTVEIEKPENLPLNESQVGVDLGIKHFLTASDGRVVENPKFLRNGLKKIKRLQRLVSRKVKGSKNRLKAKMRLANAHFKISNLRKDFLHRTTTQLIKAYGIIKIEDLNVKGMLRNHKLALAISDVGWSEFVRQLCYKSELYGRTIIKIPRFFPSSKTCSQCNTVKPELKLSQRFFVCESCGLILDRDLNAAFNIQKYTGIVPEFKPVEISVSESMKQEELFCQQ